MYLGTDGGFCHKIADGELTNLFKCILTFWSKFLYPGAYVTLDSRASLYEPMTVTRLSLPKKYWTTIYSRISGRLNYSRLKYNVYLICYTRINLDVLFICKIQFNSIWDIKFLALLAWLRRQFYIGMLAHCVHLNVTVHYPWNEYRLFSIRNWFGFFPALSIVCKFGEYHLS